MSVYDVLGLTGADHDSMYGGSLCHFKGLKSPTGEAHDNPVRVPPQTEGTTPLTALITDQLNPLLT